MTRQESTRRGFFEHGGGEGIGRAIPSTASFSEPHDTIELYHLGLRGIFLKAGPLYESGASLRDIAKELRITRHAVKQALVRYGVVLRLSTRSLKGIGSKTARRHVGIPPYGYYVRHGKLVGDSKEQEVITLIQKLRTSGMSLTGIAEHLNKHKVRPRTSKKWDHSLVGRILQRLIRHKTR